MEVFLNKKKLVLPKVLILVFVLLILIGFLNLFSQQIRNLFYSTSSPLQKKFWRAGDSTAGLFGTVFNSGNLASENEQLKKENQNLLSKISSLEEIEKQNEAIRKMILSDPEGEFSLLATDAIGVDTYQNFLSIDKGSDNGITENMPVINSEKVLYGKVSKVYKNFSKVMLISDKSSVVDVKIINADTTLPPVYGAIKGTGELGLYLDLVPYNCEIKNSDVLATSALEGVFPKGLLVGKITSCSKDDQKPFQQAKVEPFFDAGTADKLFVITNYKKEK